MSGQPAAGSRQPLDEVMLAMDVVDTLRHRSQVVERELAQDGRDEELKARLRKIYAAQGIDVPDHVIDEGVAALKEDRFVYHPPRDSFSLKLARFYVNRDRWGKWLLGALGVVVLGIALLYFAVLAPRAALPESLQSARDEAVQLARVDDARDQALKLYDQGRVALKKGDTGAAKAALGALTDLQDRLEQTYSLLIVSREGEQTGLWRNNRKNSRIRNYYIVVEAIGPTGKAVRVPITSEETGKTEAVSQWAVRVDQSVYEAVGRDKQDDGIVQKKRFGEKRKGYLEPEYTYPTRDGAITRW